MPAVPRFDNEEIVHIPGVDHPESLAVGPRGELYTTGTGCQVYRVDVAANRAEQFAATANRCLGQAVDTPNAIALDADKRYLYLVETFGAGIARVAIDDAGSAGRFERVLHMPRHVPDGIAFDEEGRLWIACHRPDAIYVFDLDSRRLELFAEDWMGEALRGPTDVAFAGPERDILFAASLDNLVIHRFDGVGVRGLPLNHPAL